MEEAKRLFHEADTDGDMYLDYEVCGGTAARTLRECRQFNPNPNAEDEKRESNVIPSLLPPNADAAVW